MRSVSYMTERRCEVTLMGSLAGLYPATDILSPSILTLISSSTTSTLSPDVLQRRRFSSCGTATPSPFTAFFNSIAFTGGGFPVVPSALIGRLIARRAGVLSTLTLEELHSGRVAFVGTASFAGVAFSSRDGLRSRFAVVGAFVGVEEGRERAGVDIAWKESTVNFCRSTFQGHAFFALFFVRLLRTLTCTQKSIMPSRVESKYEIYHFASFFLFVRISRFQLRDYDSSYEMRTQGE